MAAPYSRVEYKRVVNGYEAIVHNGPFKIHFQKLFNTVHPKGTWFWVHTEVEPQYHDTLEHFLRTQEAEDNEKHFEWNPRGDNG